MFLVSLHLTDQLYNKICQYDLFPFIKSTRTMLRKRVFSFSKGLDEIRKSVLCIQKFIHKFHAYARTYPCTHILTYICIHKLKRLTHRYIFIFYIFVGNDFGISKPRRNLYSCSSRKKKKKSKVLMAVIMAMVMIAMKYS